MYSAVGVETASEGYNNDGTGGGEMGEMGVVALAFPFRLARSDWSIDLCASAGDPNVAKQSDAIQYKTRQDNFESIKIIPLLKFL